MHDPGFEIDSTPILGYWAERMVISPVTQNDIFATTLISWTILGASMSPLDNPSSPSGAVPPSQAIVEAIAAHEGVDVTEVEPPTYDPLFTVVNPEALDELFDPTSDSASDVVVTLEYEGYTVVVRGGSEVKVSEQSSDDSINHPIEE